MYYYSLESKTKSGIGGDTTMTREEFLKLYWRQYQILEKDMIVTDDFVTIDGKNYGTFSAQYVKIFLTTCSEIDSIAEQMRKLIGESNPEIETKGISLTKKIAAVKTQFEKLEKMTIVTKQPYAGIKSTPFAKFDENSTDCWWQDYNHVKHNRTELIEGSDKYYYEKANLKNCMIAMSALYLLCVLLYELIGCEPTELESKLFEDGYQYFN